jgi:phosphoglycerol transferase MdoB-like AlkP superfamily enzyme
MFSIRKPVSALCLLVAMGLIQRLLIFVVCYSKFGPVGDLFFSLLSGCVYDLSFAGILFFCYFILSGLAAQKIIRPAYLTVILLWTTLNAVDVYSLYYNGVRSSVNSLNLFKLTDLADKLNLSLVHVEVLFLAGFFSWLVYRFRDLITPGTLLLDWKQTAAYVILLSFLSFLYLPFPLNYYNDQVKISKEARQLAVNPFFSWLTSLILYSEKDYQVDPQKALQELKAEMNYPALGNNSMEHPVVYKDSASTQVILIIMESFGASRIGALQGKKALSPNFDSLCREGTLYSKCFACGPRTQYAISTLLYGFPHILGYNLFRENKLKLNFSGLMELLGRNGYASHFLHGGRAAYDDMSLFLKQDAEVDIKDASQMTACKFKNAWGVDDESFFNFAANYMASGQGKNFYCLLTMSNHEPFQLPLDFSIQASYGDLSEAEKTFLYSDHALGACIRKLKQNKVYEKSLIIITGDHGEHYPNEGDETKLFHVPLLVIDHRQRNTVTDAPCSHADVAEYILSKTGYQGKSHLMGQGLTDKRCKKTYYRGYDDDICKVTDSVLYRYKLRDQTLSEITCYKNMYVQGFRTLSLTIEKNRRIAREILAYYTANKFIFENGLYHSGQ